MRLEYSFIFFQYLIIYCQYIFPSVRALIGQNVRNAEEHEFPFIVAILRKKPEVVPERDVACAGSLLSSEHILTSEHCVTGEQVSGIKIMVGSSDIMRGKPHYPAWWISYDQWATSKNLTLVYQGNDFLMLKLTELVSTDVYPTVLSNIPNTRLYNLECQLAAWGLKSINGTSSRFLRTAEVKTLKFAACKSRVDSVGGRSYVLEQRLICSIAEPYVLMQPGDSGGPILYHGAVIGINRGTCPDLEGRFHEGKVNLHFAVADYEEFIEDILYGS